ncbi:hypothetical protein Pan97_35190 [Bremerella volcania]|uniref:Bacterial type II and III secretion system protein n=1 Tax=Bremerella volcania TaxID=2527984 RepID=A0A518CB83_9BACT|nr:hypothetical protein [Bremerella volcania]QDU76469.1 hypothetical protein Pan97_35190 [Bremerella volcania]
MAHLRCLVLFTVISAFFPTIVIAQSPRVMVELAFVSRTAQSSEQPLKEEFEKQLQQSELAKEGLIPFLDDWLRGKDRDLHEVDLMQLKVSLGEEVEFVTRHSLAAEFQDPKAMFHMADISTMPGENLLSDGLDATVRTKQKPDGKIVVDFRFGKRMPATMEKAAGSDEPVVPLLHRQWINSNAELSSGETLVLGGLLRSQKKDGKDLMQELTILVRVHRADPAPFPVN